MQESQQVHNSRKRARRKVKAKKGKVVHHKDGNPLNNSGKNLVTITGRLHRVLHGR